MASVTFKRGTRAEIEATAKQDGQILMETDQNKKNKMYIDLPDGSRVLIGNSGEAIDTSYDNTTSGLDATNVQNAIDKIESNVGDISGITDSLTATSSNIALSAAGGNNLQGQIDALNRSLSDVSIISDRNRRIIKSFSNKLDIVFYYDNKDYGYGTALIIGESGIFDFYAFHNIFSNATESGVNIKPTISLGTNKSKAYVHNKNGKYDLQFIFTSSYEHGNIILGGAITDYSS